MVFCNEDISKEDKSIYYVTILILVDGFLQFWQAWYYRKYEDCHNPYFSRWFSAIYHNSEEDVLEIKSQSLF